MFQSTLNANLGQHCLTYLRMRVQLGKPAIPLAASDQVHLWGLVAFTIFGTFRETSSSVVITRFTCESVDVSSGAYRTMRYS